jgi:hypothetical protein
LSYRRPPGEIRAAFFTAVRKANRKGARRMDDFLIQMDKLPVRSFIIQASVAIERDQSMKSRVEIVS